MSYPIGILSDEDRAMIAEKYIPVTGEHRKYGTVRLPTPQRTAIWNLLRGALLACAFLDNRYERPEQVAYSMECAATYMRELEDYNQYTAVFIPVERMLRDLHEEYMAALTRGGES